MKEFGRTCFKKVAYVNFDSNARMRQVFEGDINIERLILAISAETGVSIDSQDTLLLFDEVQEVPKALTALKYFCEEAPEYAIVVAGFFQTCRTCPGSKTEPGVEFHPNAAGKEK